jgi:hypothetical protein
MRILHGKVLPALEGKRCPRFVEYPFRGKSSRLFNVDVPSKPTPAVSMSMEALRIAASRPTLYLIIILCSILGALAYKLRAESIFACPASGYGSGQYLAYCQTTGYGDYDHGAFWFNLEPEARRAAADADVLFLGNSRMQFALSTEATNQWFSSSSALFYLLGFSFGENFQFEAPLLARLKPRAAVYVINVDRFFDEDLLTAPAEAIRLRSNDMQSSYEEKRRWQVFHKGICTSIPAVCGNQVAFFRARGDGAWQLRGSEDFKAGAVADVAPDASDIDRRKRAAVVGEDFVSHLPVDRRCVILTITPWAATKTSEARATADALKLDLIAPEIEGLRTLDGDHLDHASAQRWSTAFFDAAGPRIRQCLRDARPVAR